MIILLGDLFSYLPISLSVALMNRPFPFEHLQAVPNEHGIGIQIGYWTINEARNEPYWLVWSLALYVGIATTVFANWRTRK